MYYVVLKGNYTICASVNFNQNNFRNLLPIWKHHKQQVKMLSLSFISWYFLPFILFKQWPTLLMLSVTLWDLCIHWHYPIILLGMLFLTVLYTFNTICMCMFLYSIPNICMKPHLHLIYSFWGFFSSWFAFLNRKFTFVNLLTKSLHKLQLQTLEILWLKSEMCLNWQNCTLEEKTCR